VSLPSSLSHFLGWELFQKFKNSKSPAYDEAEPLTHQILMRRGCQILAAEGESLPRWASCQRKRGGCSALLAGQSLAAIILKNNIHGDTVTPHAELKSDCLPAPPRSKRRLVLWCLEKSLAAQNGAPKRVKPPQGANRATKK